MEIRPLEKETYAGKKFTARYQTSGSYDICTSEAGFPVKYVPFEAPVGPQGEQDPQGPVGPRGRGPQGETAKPVNRVKTARRPSSPSRRRRL